MARQAGKAAELPNKSQQNIQGQALPCRHGLVVFLPAALAGRSRTHF